MSMLNRATRLLNLNAACTRALKYWNNMAGIFPPIPERRRTSDSCFKQCIIIQTDSVLHKHTISPYIYKSENLRSKTNLDKKFAKSLQKQQRSLTNPVFIRLLSSVGGGEGNWTPVRKLLTEAFYECSWCFSFPKSNAHQQALQSGSPLSHDRIQGSFRFTFTANRRSYPMRSKIGQNGRLNQAANATLLLSFIF